MVFAFRRHRARQKSKTLLWERENSLSGATMRHLPSRRQSCPRPETQGQRPRPKRSPGLTHVTWGSARLSSWPIHHAATLATAMATATGMASSPEEEPQGKHVVNLSFCLEPGLLSNKKSSMQPPSPTQSVQLLTQTT